MKIHFPLIKHALGVTALAGIMLASSANKIHAQNPIIPDTFVKTGVFPAGTEDSTILAKAPSAEVKVAGKNKFAVFVVDVYNNILYHYNEAGKAIKAYSVATGKESTPTQTGLRVVSHVETYPYTSAGRYTKRRRNPSAYGPKIIILDKLNPETGERSITGEYIHGTNNLESIGKKVSHGCMRLDNDVVTKLSQLVKRGDIVLIK